MLGIKPSTVTATISFLILLYNVGCSQVKLGEAKWETECCKNNIPVRIPTNHAVCDTSCVVPDIKQVLDNEQPIKIAIDSVDNYNTGKIPYLIITVTNASDGTIYMDKDLITFFHLDISDAETGSYIMPKSFYDGISLGPSSSAEYARNLIDEKDGSLSVSKGEGDSAPFVQYRFSRNPADVFVPLQKGQSLTKALSLNEMFPACDQSNSLATSSGERWPASEHYIKYEIPEYTNRISIKVLYGVREKTHPNFQEYSSQILKELFGMANYPSKKVTIWKGRLMESNIIEINIQ